MTNETTTIEGWRCYINHRGEPYSEAEDEDCCWIRNARIENSGLLPPIPVISWLLAKHDELRGGFRVGKLLTTAAEQVAALKDGWRLRFRDWTDDWCALPSRDAVRTEYGSGNDHMPLEHWMDRGDSPSGEYWTIVGRQLWATEPGEASVPSSEPLGQQGREHSSASDVDGVRADVEAGEPNRISVTWGEETRTLDDHECLNGPPYEQHFADEELAVYRDRETRKWWATFVTPRINSEGPLTATPQDAVAALYDRLTVTLGCYGWRERVAELEKQLDTEKANFRTLSAELGAKLIALKTAKNGLIAERDAKPPTATSTTDGVEAVKRLRDAGFEVGRCERCGGDEIIVYLGRVAIADRTKRGWEIFDEPRHDIRTTDDLHAALLAEIQRIVGERYGGLKTRDDCVKAMRDGWRIAGRNWATWVAKPDRASDLVVYDDGEQIHDSNWKGYAATEHYRIVGRQWPEGEGVSDDAPAPDYPPATELDRLREEIGARLAVANFNRDASDEIANEGILGTFTAAAIAEEADSQARALIAMRGKCPSI